MREASKSKDTFIASEFDLSGGKPTLVKVHSKELHDLAAKYSSLIAESFFLQNVRGTYSDFDSYLRKAHSALLAFLKSKTLDPEDPNLLLRALYNGRVPHNSPFKPTPVVRDKKENTKGPPPSAAAGAASQTSQQLQQHPQLPKPPEINHPKKYTEKLKAEASVVQRISELQKEGMWYDRRLPRNHEPSRIKAHWDYLLEEMTWLATDFASERKWKRNASKRCAKMIDKYFNDREIERLRAEKEEEIRLRRIASFIAKEIKNFWSNAQQIVEYKEQSRIEEMKKKALDQQLSYIVDQTEKYSSMLAESFVGDSSIISNATDTHDTTGGDTTCGPHSLETPSDDEFEPAQESEDDDEETIAKEEEENEEGENELYDLERNGQMSLDDLLDDLPPGYLEELTSKIDKVNETEPPASETDKPPPSPAGSDKNEIAKTLVRGEKPPSEVLPTPEENEVEGTDCTKVSDEAAIAEPVIEELDASVEGVAADSASEFESEVDESESETAEEDPSTETEDSDILTDAEEDEPEDEEQTVGLASLLQTFAPERAGELHEEDAALNSVAAMAESFQPKGYTLSSQTVNTKVPSLLHHTLREYQLIGLDWLVTMHEKKLNGILADEMGLGKTIQTIALLAHLACEKGNWGPHLIVVPTSVMLNWEMEFKKWCPGFKILTYYGSIKERRLKRTGWTKPNAFHICITSYKLVIQDHGSFRRKRWKYLILDEAQNIKNFKSQRWQLLLNFSTHRRLLLTGTPLQNNLMELWSLMHFLMPNVFQSHREFREWFSNPVSGMVEGNSEYNENIIRRLHKVLRPFILRRLKSEVEKQLPKKHEHVVMCRLSKRQRFLYEDFMSRSKTKETLATGNLLSVINVLMQLRKVCNHPNLFESRPVISPLLSVGITYLIPSIVWNLYENLVKDTTHPLFGMSKSDLLYTKSQSERILNLKPPGEDNYSPNTLSSPDSYFSSCGSLKRKHPDQEEDITEYDYILQTTVVSTLPDGSIKCAPKRRKFLKWCADVALPAPRTKAPIPFFLMNVDPTPYLDDINFVEAVGESAPKPFYLKVVSQPSETERQQIPNNDNHLLPAEAAFQNNVIPEVPSPTLSSPETQRCKPKSYQDDEDLSESDSLDEEEDEREDNEYEEDSFEEDSDDISESYSDDIDDEGPSRKRRKRTLAPKGDFKRLRRMSLMKKDEDKSKDSNSMEEIADSTEIDDTASEDYNLDKRNKVNCGMRKSYSGAQWAKAMGYSPSEFQETDVQARSIRNRRALIDRLKFVNDQRCEVLPVFGFDALDQCRILGSLPVMRYYGTRCRHLKIPYRGRSIKRDYINNGYFLQGYEEVYSISQVKNSQSAYIRNHPLLIWRHTKALMSAVWSLEEVLEEFSPILKRFIIYVPAVSSPLLTSRIFRPSPSLYAQQFNVEEELREVLRQPSAILHPIISSMSTQFPDPRLIQYDCGKLQILDTLLRRLKSESHRVLIFTQMAKMLDVLEAFLNYHGHIYLRLDGATRIDQRQILMEKFNSDKRIFCFILSTRSGGIGINLTGADTVIFYDSDWNPTMDAQAQDRCHRIGQTRDVHIYRLVSEKTIEENILKKSNQKRLLGELAIEGGNFTTAFFQKHSIYELFDVQTNENDAMKRLTEKSEESEKTLEIHDVEIDETDKKVGVVPDTVDKNQMQIFESALAAAEDETDVQATRTVKAEAAAELAEFDESIPLEDLGDGQDIVEKSMIDTEMESIMAELSKVEIYALKFMESTIDDWSRETVAQAQKELEQQKREWEMEQIRQLEARNKMGTDYSDEEDMLTYSATDAQNQVNHNNQGKLPIKRGVGRPRKINRNSSNVDRPSACATGKNIDSAISSPMVRRGSDSCKDKNPDVATSDHGGAGGTNLRISSSGGSATAARTSTSSAPSFSIRTRLSGPRSHPISSSPSKNPPPSSSSKNCASSPTFSPQKTYETRHSSSSKDIMGEKNLKSSDKEDATLLYDTPTSGRISLRSSNNTAYQLRRVVPVKKKYSPTLSSARSSKVDSIIVHDESTPNPISSSQLDELVLARLSPSEDTADCCSDSVVPITDAGNNSNCNPATKRRVGRPRKVPFTTTVNINPSNAFISSPQENHSDCNSAGVVKDVKDEIERGSKDSNIIMDIPVDVKTEVKYEITNNSSVDVTKANGNLEEILHDDIEVDEIIVSKSGKRRRRGRRPIRKTYFNSSATTTTSSASVTIPQSPSQSSIIVNNNTNGLTKSLRSQHKQNTTNSYSSGNVWISQGGGEHFMPLWAPPTPPSDDSDVYVDNCHGFLYDYDLIPESNLPPVYQPPKKDKKPVVIPVPNVKQSIIPVPVLTNLPDEEVVTPLNSTIEKKSPKVPRRDEPIFAPRSLFDRPSPAMAKLRRDYRLQKYNCRPVVTAALNKSSLGPGAITFPIVHPTSTKAPSPPPQHESVEWMIAEDHALLQTIQTILEMPLSLLVVNLAQTPNWDLAAEMVNLTSKIHRTPKQCKIRYETIVGPREEGKLFYEQPPAAKNKKKSKSFIKVGPPSPSRTGRIVKMSQLITADNNSQLLNTYVAKFDLVKNVAMKRPLTKPMTLNPHMKTNKQAATIFAEHGINLESPISATAIAQARYERLQLERKKLYAAQQAAVAAAGTIQSPHPVTTAALNAAAALAAEGNRISAATAVTIPLTTVGATSVIVGPIVSNAVIVPSSVGINVSPGTATVVTATASEVHKAKIAAQAAHASDLPVIRFTHPASATTLQEMIQRRSPGTTSNNPIISKRQHVLSQQQNQLQQQLQSLQQSQMTHKNPKISLQFAQVAQKPSLATTTLQQTGGVQQIQVSSAQQVVIGQPSSNLAKAQPGSNLNTSVQLQGQRQVMMQGSGQMVTQQAQSSVLSQPSIQLQQKQVVMAYQQAVSQASQQQKQQQIQIQLPQSPTVQTGTIQQATVPAQSIHVSSPQSVIINQPTSIATSITPNSPITTSIQLQGQKQIVMTGSGQAQILTQQQQQISQSTIQLQGQKQVVMAYQTGSQGQIIQKQSPQITQQLQQSQQQQQQQTQVHVHLHTPSSQGTGVTLGHQTQTVVLPQGLAQALVSSAANLTPTLNLMTTTSPVLTTMTSSGVTTSGVVTPGSVSIPRTQQVGSHTAQQGRTVTMQLVKQHTVGGKTVTRTVSDSEIAAFLKQHGLTPSTRVAIAGQPGTQAQIGQLTGTKGQQVAQVQVPAAQIITSMGLQKLGYQISPGGGAQVATVLKTPASQASSAQGASLAFPLSFSQVRNVSQKTGTHNLNKQPTQISTFQQQILSQQRRQTQQQQQTASKLAHIAQVSSSQGSVPQLIVQATPKQIQNTINVQHIQHVLKPSQVIQGQSGVLQAQLLAHKTMSRMVTSSASAAAVSSGTVSGVSPTMVTVSSNSGSGLPTAVTIPTSLVAAPSGQGGIIRISQQNQSIKPGSIQMITAQTASLLNQQQSLARPYAQGQNISTLNVTSGAVGNQSLPIRLQGSTSNVLPSPATLTNVSGAGVIVSETGNVITSVAEVTSPATKIILTEEAVKSSSSDTNANPTDNAV
ncbi:unnamed protein product [Allacma fusca]|uniref:Uncharacterized protein n=1 Tax=Allacma fusca TaxID=39272 RepID=A0A8J2LLP5_9HEXA|nr:unnamed protein product [Allacma fusca]